MTAEDGSKRPQPFRVLALDGGGIKGTYTASVIANLEAMTGKHVADHFELITGTSTGGIIAVALGLGLTGQQILDFYLKRGPEIFPVPAPGWRGFVAELWRHLRQPKHSQKVLSEAIKKVVGDRTLGDSKCRLVIPAYDGVRGNIQLFKTAHTEHYKQDYQKPALVAALGTSAAPTYFPAYTEAGGGTYLDGGVWANCPTMVGLIEATAILGNSVEDVEIVSIGTTSEPFDVSRRRRAGGILAWGRGVVELLMQAQVDAALGQASLLMKARMLRIDAVTRPGRFSLDNAGGISDLQALGEQSARQHEKEISRRFLQRPAEPFVPYYRIEKSAAEVLGGV